MFLSYRRSDCEAAAQTMYYCLIGKVDGIQLFRDSDTLQPGMVFSDVIDQCIANCDAVVMLIGKKWLTAKGESGQLRLNEDGDWVRLEIASALRQRKRVLPCLIDGARMPSAAQLPDDLKEVAKCHATPVSMAHFDRDVGPLIKVLQTWTRQR